MSLQDSENNEKIDEIQPNQRAILEAYCVPPASKSYLARIPDSEFPRLMSLSPWPRPSLNKNKISSPHPGAVVQPFTWNYAACCHSHIPRHFPFPGPPRLFSSPFAISQQFATDGQACRLAAQKSPVLPRLAALTSGPPADQPQSNNTINASLSMLVVFGSIYLAISPASPLLSFPRSCPDPPPGTYAARPPVVPVNCHPVGLSALSSTRIPDHNLVPHFRSNITTSNPPHQTTTGLHHRGLQEA